MLISLTLLCLAWLAFYLWVDQARWSSWDIGIDTAAWGQVVHQGSQGKGWVYTGYPAPPDSTAPRSILSTHSFWLTPLLGLLYHVWPHPLALFASIHLAHIFGAFLIGLIAWYLSPEDHWFAFGAALLFLLVPAHALAQTRYDFSFRHWALFLIPLAAFLSLTPHRFRPLVPLLFLAAAEENMSLISGFFCFSLACQWSEHRCWFAGWGLAFCLYTVLAIKVCIPFFLENGFQLHFSGRYAHLATGVGAWASSFFTADNARYAIGLLAPLGFVALWRPSIWLIAAIPFALQNLLSLMGDTRLLGHHYTTPLAVVLFLASLPGLSSLSRRPRAYLLAGLIGMNLLLAITWYPTIAWLIDGPDARSYELQAAFAPLELMIPEGGTLSAPPSVAARFWYKSGLWFFPQGAEIADWIVVPKYLPGYPALTTEALTQAMNQLQQRSDLVRAGENQDIIVFRRRIAKKP